MDLQTVLKEKSQDKKMKQLLEWKAESELAIKDYKELLEDQKILQDEKADLVVAKESLEKIAAQ